MAFDLKRLLLDRRSEFQHQDPEHAADMCFTVVYGCLARYLGLGAPDSEEGGWNQLIEDLGLIALAFLVVDLRQATAASKNPR